MERGLQNGSGGKKMSPLHKAGGGGGSDRLNGGGIFHCVHPYLYFNCSTH